MIYVENVGSNACLSFISGDVKNEMIIFVNIVKAMSLHRSDSVTSTNIMMQYGDVKKVVNVMKAFDDIDVVFVDTSMCSWRETVQDMYRTKLINWGDMHDLY